MELGTCFVDAAQQRRFLQHLAVRARIDKQAQTRISAQLIGPLSTGPGPIKARRTGFSIVAIGSQAVLEQHKTVPPVKSLLKARLASSWVSWA